MHLDMRQSGAYQDLMRRAGTRVEALGSEQVAYVFRMRFLPFISILLIQRTTDPAVLEAADRLARRYLSFTAKIAPKALAGSPEALAWREALQRHGYVVDKYPAAPTKTLLVDLGRSDEELLNDMKPKTRYNVRLAERRGVSVEVVDGATLAGDSDRMEAFARVFSENAKRLGEDPIPRGYLDLAASALKSNLFTVFARVADGDLGAVASFIVAADTVTYMLNGSTEKGRHDFAPNRAIWAAMLEGKRRGCRWFDFDGLYDERYQPTEAWQGFTRFKLGFGGQETTYMGSYVKRWPFLKRRPTVIPL